MSLSEQNRAQDALRWIYKHGFRHSSECPASVNEAFNQAFANERAARTEGVAALQQAGEPVAWMIAHKLTGHMQSFRKNFYLNADLVCRQTDYLRSRSDVAEVETTPLYASPLPQQTALVEQGVEE